MVISFQSPYVDKYNHVIEDGVKYIRCNYLEKINEKRGKVEYKFVEEDTFVMPFQIFCPSVTVSDKLTVDVGEYVFLCDMTYL